MALLGELQEPAWTEWVDSRPPVVRDIAKRFPPNKLYKMMSSNRRVTIHSYAEDGTLTVNVTGDFNRVLFARKVFGIKPTDLVECDLPDPIEKLGDLSEEAGYDQKDVEEILIPKIRESMFGKEEANRIAEKIKSQEEQ